MFRLKRIGQLAFFYLASADDFSLSQNISCTEPVDTTISQDGCRFKCFSKLLAPCHAENNFQLCESGPCINGRCVKVRCYCLNLGCTFQCSRQVMLCIDYIYRKHTMEIAVNDRIPNYRDKNDRTYRSVPYFQRAWVSILPLFILILISLLLTHFCNRCFHKSHQRPMPILPLAPSAPLSSPVLSSSPLVMTSTSIHSNPLDHYMIPHPHPTQIDCRSIQETIRDSDPRARRSVLRSVQRTHPSAPSVELLSISQPTRFTNNLPTDLPPPYYLAVQLEEPPPRYSTLRHL